MFVLNFQPLTFEMGDKLSINCLADQSGWSGQEACSVTIIPTVANGQGMGKGLVKKEFYGMKICCIELGHFP